MKVKKIAIVTTILLFGVTNFLFGDASEDAIAKALAGINTITVMKSAAPQIVSQSEPMVLSTDRPKVTKKPKVNRTVKRTAKRKVRQYRRVKPVVSEATMEDLPMAKSYPMSYDVSKITE